MIPISSWLNEHIFRNWFAYFIFFDFFFILHSVSVSLVLFYFKFEKPFFSIASHRLTIDLFYFTIHLHCNTCFWGEIILYYKIGFLSRVQFRNYWFNNSKNTIITLEIFPLILDHWRSSRNFFFGGVGIYGW